MFSNAPSVLRALPFWRAAAVVDRCCSSFSSISFCLGGSLIDRSKRVAVLSDFFTFQTLPDVSVRTFSPPEELEAEALEFVKPFLVAAGVLNLERTTVDAGLLLDSVVDSADRAVAISACCLT